MTIPRAPRHRKFAIRRTAKVQTDWLDSPAIKQDLQGPAIDFASIKEQPTTIYLVLPPERLATHGVRLRLMVTSILLPLLRSVEAAPAPALFMLDEFAQLGPAEPAGEEPAPGELATTTLTLPWAASNFVAVKKGIVHEPSTKSAIAKARGWIEDLRLGRVATFAEIADRGDTLRKPSEKSGKRGNLDTDTAE